MLDFVNIYHKFTKDGCQICIDFKAVDTEYLMIRGSRFYAMWDEEFCHWTKNPGRAQQIIDNELTAYYKNHPELNGARICYLWDCSTGSIDKWNKYCQQQMYDRYHELDSTLTFANQQVTRETYHTKRLKYDIGPGNCDAFLELIETLYSPEERHKLMWSIGSIFAGDSVDIQKFVVMYGAAGTGKSTMLKIIQKLFDGYYTTFDAQSIGQRGNRFALAPFRNNPLVAIQHDGDLSRIEDNTRLNSLISHELQPIEDKYEKTFEMQVHSFLFLGSNKPVKITDSKSGLLRRLIDVSPTGQTVPVRRYNELMRTIQFELGAIAQYCLDIYKNDPTYYDGYIPTAMMSATNALYDFILEYYQMFEENNETTLANAYRIYKDFCSDSNWKPMPRLIFKSELADYFEHYTEEKSLNRDGVRVRNLYSGFIKDKFINAPKLPKRVEATADWLQMGSYESIFDKMCSGCYAQYANSDGYPIKKWDNVETTLSQIDTKTVHYVRVPENHIVIDFDIPGEDGKKNLNKNLAEAAKFPPTYAELSKSGGGIHLHYIYRGDVKKLSSVYKDHIEIKVYTGNQSLRRRLSVCNNMDISEISSGLPLRKEKTNVVDSKVVKDANELKDLIIANLNKRIHKSTASSVDYIYVLLENAYRNGLSYDMSVFYNDAIDFASRSTHQKDLCKKKIRAAHWKSDKPAEPISYEEDTPIVFFDVEVFPNLFLVNWKFQGEEHKVNRLINPTARQMTELSAYKLVGFNNRKYDNHMIFARRIGFTNEQLYDLSQRIIGGDNKAMFADAYNLSYTDIYDFCSTKQSLKKWEIELGIKHKELGLPWDEPVPKEKWEIVAEYCDNDVIATEAVWNARQADFIAREILADVAGLTVNHTTNQLTTKIIFGDEKEPQGQFNYRNMGECSNSDIIAPGFDEFTRFNKDGKPVFPGYSFNPRSINKSQYRDIEDVGEGGHVYAIPGMYGRTITFDVASMHPSSIIAEELFGPYTERFNDILQARIAIKHKDYSLAKNMLDGKLSKYLDNQDRAKALSQALKIAINSVYGLTAASFKCPFKDPRNIDNIVAKRGALFMINLRHEVEKRGGKVIHIKTDSIKVVDPSMDICNFIVDYGKLYGYNFEIEHIFDRICLVNNAVYIGKLASDDPESGGEGTHWEATGTQFAVPYVFKTLFSKEPITIEDKSETKSVSTALYLDMNENLPEGEHEYKFIGKVGLFCPILPGYSAGELVRKKGEKYDSANGCKGYRWLEQSEVIAKNLEEAIDISYYQSLVDAAIDSIAKFGDPETFIE